ncbi:hypothetical protein [Myxosarcina sp. GI1]|uniref:hypothetical protein n=1 Tax=Myxosarcina sp. GI1 TaxID=1541065 RepID=UPI00056AA9C4|nr:hypothetical protein [Myxosarcina sp. GI1]
MTFSQPHSYTIFSPSPRVSIMPSPDRVQLNLSVEPKIKESLRKHCDRAGVSFAQAITKYVEACDRQGKLIFHGTANASALDIDQDNFVTQEQLSRRLKQFNEDVEARIASAIANQKQSSR